MYADFTGEKVGESIIRGIKFLARFKSSPMYELFDTHRTLASVRLTDASALNRFVLKGTSTLTTE